jgi:hypothetical protein
LIYHPVGELNASDILNYIHNVLSDPDYQIGLLEYINLSQVTKWSISHRDVEGIVHYDGKETQSIKQISKTGVWAPQEIAFGMARMYQILAEKYHHKIFISKNESEVLEYLNLSKQILDQISL